MKVISHSGASLALPLHGRIDIAVELLESVCSYFNTALPLQARVQAISRDLPKAREFVDSANRARAGWMQEERCGAQCFWVLDVAPDGRLKYAGIGPVLESMLGCLNAEITGKLMEEVLSSEDYSKVIMHYQRCMLGVRVDFEDDFMFAGGMRRFRVSINPVKDAEGDVCRIIGSAIEIIPERGLKIA